MLPTTYKRRVYVGRSLYSRAILFDTSAILANLSRGDPHHSEAVACLEEVARQRLPLFIAIPTFYEAFRRVLFDLGRERAWEFADAVLSGTVNIIRTTDVDEAEASRLLRRYSSLNLTLTDAASMATMTRLGIAAVFSFDSHFLSAGFIRVPPLHVP